MKIKYLLEHLRGRDGELIAMFGDARLVSHLGGKIQLIGGTPDDRRAAREWCSMFLHEAAVAGAACIWQRIFLCPSPRAGTCVLVSRRWEP